MEHPMPNGMEREAMEHLKQSESRFRLVFLLIVMALAIFTVYMLVTLTRAVNHRADLVTAEVKAENQKNNQIIICLLMMPVEMRTNEAVQDCELDAIESRIQAGKDAMPAETLVQKIKTL